MVVLGQQCQRRERQAGGLAGGEMTGEMEK
jgi:hypothetical protein